MTGVADRLGPGTRATTAVRVAFGALAVVVFIRSAIPILTTFPVALDAIIPLEAAKRWLAGGVVYAPDGFTNQNLLPPFLYPPFVLPLVAPFTLPPEILVRWAWVAVLLGLALLTMRRLAIPWVIVPFVLLWTPMLGGLWGGNVSVAMFAAFVAAFWRTPARHDLDPEPRDLDGAEPPDARVAWLAASVASIKLSQAQAWLAMAGRSLRAAVLGALPWVAVVVVTLPLVGLDSYGAWLAQLGRASDPSWAPMGPSLLHYLGTTAFTILTLASFVVALRLRGRDTGVWLGLVMLLVTPNMHNHSALFLLPALLRIRREVALVAAMLTGTLTYEGWWLGIALVTVVMLAGQRWPFLREPSLGDPPVVG
jgi:glycosyl transferase family 87